MEYVYDRAYGKKRVKPSGRKNGSGRLRDIYADMFKYHGLLPKEVGEQKPRVLFDMIDGLTYNADARDIPASARMLYE